MNIRFAHGVVFGILTASLAGCGGDGEPAQSADYQNNADATSRPLTGDATSHAEIIGLPAAIPASTPSGNN